MALTKQEEHKIAKIFLDVNENMWSLLKLCDRITQTMEGMSDTMLLMHTRMNLMQREIDRLEGKNEA